jgi:glycosyltransferase involved in cell wall biosynthesis
MIVQLSLGDSVRLHGSVSDAELGAFYEASDVLVCVSEHEGFCVPLIEAMYHGLPVVAFAAGAVPETLGSAGLVLDTKGPARIAAAAHRVVSDDVLRAEMVAAGHERVDHFALDATKQRLVDALEPLLGDAAGAKL